MGKIEVVNIKVYKGPYIYIGRPSVLGNPFRLVKSEPRGSTLKKHMQYLRDCWAEGPNNPVRAELVRLARLVKNGQDVILGCYCKPNPCHGDNLKYVIETLIKKGLV